MFLGMKNYKTEKKNLSGKMEFEAGWVLLSQCVCHFLALLRRALQWLFTVPCASCLGVLLPLVENQDNLIPSCLHCGSSSTGFINLLAGTVRGFFVLFLKNWWCGLKVLRC